jgi:hypothetical protein
MWCSLQAESPGSADTVVLTRAEYQRLLQQAESERLRADSLDTMLRHVRARLATAGTGTAAAPTAVGSAPGGHSADAAAAAAAEGGGASTGAVFEPTAEVGSAGPHPRGGDSPGLPAPVPAAAADGSSSDSQVGQQSASQSAAAPAGPAGNEQAGPGPPPSAPAQQQQSPRQEQQQPSPTDPSPQLQQQQQAQQPSPYHQIAIAASPVLSALDGAVAAAAAADSEESGEDEAAAAAAVCDFGWGPSLGDACLEKSSNLQPEQLDLLKVCSGFAAWS